MTREEAIETLRNTAWLGTDKKVGQVEEAIQIAIKALEAQDVDAVSRQAVMWMLTNLSYNQCKTQGEADVIDTAKTMVMTMPSAQSEKVQLSQEDATFDTSTGIIDRPTNAPTDCISRQAAIDALDVLCQEHRYRIPGKRETYSQYNEAWQDALDRAEGAIFNLPSAQPERIQFADKDYVWIDGKQYISLQRFQKAVKEAQQEIIHCRDCKNCQIDSVFHDYWCDGRKVTKYHYCGYAERRTDE